MRFKYEPIRKKPRITRAARRQAYDDLRSDLYGNNVHWAQVRIDRLVSIAQVERIEALERAHPEYEGGRKGVLAALEQRRREFGA